MNAGTIYQQNPCGFVFCGCPCGKAAVIGFPIFSRVIDFSEPTCAMDKSRELQVARDLRALRR